MRLRASSAVLVACVSLARVAHPSSATDAADAKFIEACGRDLSTNAECDPLTDARRALWAEAATLYEAALADDPMRATMRAAFAAMRAGDVARALRADERFVSATFASEPTLRALERARPSDYKARVDFIALVLEDEAATSHALFDYRAAAETNLRIARHARLPPEKCANGGRNALVLFRALGDRPKLLAAHASLQALPVAPEARANLDYLVASFDDNGVVGALSTFYDAYKGRSVAARYVVEAAWRVARAKKTAGDARYRDWYKNVLAAWTCLQHTEPSAANQSPFVDYAAEAEFVPLDEEIRAKFDYETGHAQYVTQYPTQIFGQSPNNQAKIANGTFDVDWTIADDYALKLRHVVDTYKSREWTPAALARMGSLYDSLRTGLYYCGGSQFHVLTPQQQARLAAMRNSGIPVIVDLADSIEANIRRSWYDRRASVMDAVDLAMVPLYAKAVAYAKALNVHNPWTAHGLARLAVVTDLIGDAKMATYVNAADDPVHRGHKLMPSP